jgi:purine-nucleoside phosphorylase
VNRLRFQGADFAPTANFELLKRAYETASAAGVQVHVGNILSSDTFYTDDPAIWKMWAEYGVLAAEMETAALYTLAAKFQVNALTILTVSDHIMRHEAISAEAREKSFSEMVNIALEIAP